MHSKVIVRVLYRVIWEWNGAKKQRMLSVAHE